MKFAIGTFTTKLLEDGDEALVRTLYMASFARHNDADFDFSWKTRKRRSSMGLFYKATLIGFGLTVEDNRLAFLAVSAGHRGSGIGSQLLESILETLDYCYLIPVNNLKVIDWYQRHGFVRCEADRQYAPDEAHFIMTYYSPVFPVSPATISLASPTISREGSEISVLSI